MPDAALASAIKVEVDGQPLDGAAETALVRVVVDDHLHLPDTFELTFQETAEMKVAEEAHLRVGSRGEGLHARPWATARRAC